MIIKLRQSSDMVCILVNFHKQYGITRNTSFSTTIEVRHCGAKPYACEIHRNCKLISWVNKIT